jgi:hypothetical protein
MVSNYGINTGIVLLSPGDHKELRKELGQSLTLNMATGEVVQVAASQQIL